MSATRTLALGFSSSLCRSICVNSLQLSARSAVSVSSCSSVLFGVNPSVLCCTGGNSSWQYCARFFSVKVNASLVKKLRDRSAAPMGECKDALNSAVAELGEKASVEEDLLKRAGELLQKKGVAAGLKLSSRVGRDGLIALKTVSKQDSPLLTSASVIEINTETDFAAKSPLLLDIARRMSYTLNQQPSIVGNVDMTSFTSLPLPELPSSHIHVSLPTVNDALTHVLGTLRESIKLRRGFRFNSQLTANGADIIGAYVHRIPPSESSGVAVDLKDDSFLFGKTAALVRLSVSSPSPLPSSALTDLQFLANKLAMQVVAFQAKYLDSSHVSAEVRAHELHLLIERTKHEMKEGKEKKSDSEIQTIAERRLKKYFEDFILSEQTFVVFPNANELKVSEALKKEANKLGDGVKLKVSDMVRYQVGEGIEKEEKLDFAAEVQEKLQNAQKK